MLGVCASALYSGTYNCVRCMDLCAWSLVWYNEYMCRELEKVIFGHRVTVKKGLNFAIASC